MNVKDPLQWWVAICHTYPSLQHMALDYLSISGMFIYYMHFLFICNWFYSW